VTDQTFGLCRQILQEGTTPLQEKKVLAEHRHGPPNLETCGKGYALSYPRHLALHAPAHADLVLKKSRLRCKGTSRMEIFFTAKSRDRKEREIRGTSGSRQWLKRDLTKGLSKPSAVERKSRTKGGPRHKKPFQGRENGARFGKRFFERPSQHRAKRRGLYKRGNWKVVKRGIRESRNGTWKYGRRKKRPFAHIVAQEGKRLA